ncbi:MAG: DUF4386 domain-containing protein [Candidatus Kariarchaeaceae archaeon]|jgi:hypothetical protein
MTQIRDISKQQAARIAGFGWLLIIFTGIMAEFFLRMNLIDMNDPTATVNNIMDSRNQFKLAIFLDIIMLTADIIVGLAIYVIIKPVNRSMALLATMFRFAMAIILLLNLMNLVIVLLLLSGESYLGSFDTEEINSLVMLFLKAHGHGYDLSLIFFGLHLVLLGYVMIKSDYLPLIPGILLLFASFGYVIDSIASLFLSGEQELLSLSATVLIMIAVIAEVTISIWLILRNDRIPNNE